MSQYEIMVAAEQTKLELYQLLLTKTLSIKQFSVESKMPIHRAQHYIDGLFADKYLTVIKGRCPISRRLVNMYTSDPDRPYVVKDHETLRRNYEKSGASPHKSDEYQIPEAAKPYLRVIKGRLDRPMATQPGGRKDKIDPWYGYSSFANLGMI